MAKSEVAILDFGSQKITILVGARDVNNSINVRGMYSENYEGFMDGEFIEPKNLEKVIRSCIDGAEKICNCKIKELMVGVPTEFCFCECKNVLQSFPKQKKISQRDIDMLYDSAFVKYKTHTMINKDYVYYILGENNKVRNPIGQIDNKINACLSFIFVENSFLNLVTKALVKAEIDKFDFVSSAYAQSLYLFDDDTRDRYVLMVDCGYITSTVALIRGRGLLNMSSFSLGGGHISADLSSLLKIPFASAEKLQKKVVLCIEPDDTDSYDLMIDKAVTQVSMKVANAIVESRIEVIAKGIQKCFFSWQFNFPDFIPVILTGGGISFIKGGKDILSKILGKNVELATMPYSQFNKQNYSSSMAVLNYALDINNEGKLFRKSFK